MNIDQWKTTLPDYGGSHDADPDQAFWQGFRFSQRQGTERAYLDRYRHVARFAALVERAEQTLAHPSTCDCQTCTGAAHRGDAA